MTSRFEGLSEEILPGGGDLLTARERSLGAVGETLGFHTGR